MEYICILSVVQSVRLVQIRFHQVIPRRLFPLTVCAWATTSPLCTFLESSPLPPPPCEISQIRQTVVALVITLCSTGRVEASFDSNLLSRKMLQMVCPEVKGEISHISGPNPVATPCASKSLP